MLSVYVFVIFRYFWFLFLTILSETFVFSVQINPKIMEEACENPVPFSKGLNLRELMTNSTEFHIDMDFKKKSSGMFLNADDDLFPDMDDEDEDSSDQEDIFSRIGETTSETMLSSPEYISFEDISKKMVDCVASGDVKILIVEEGEGPLIPVDAEVTIHYAAYWERASIPFDSSLTMNRGMPMKIRLGSGKFLPGLEIGLTTVRGPTARFHLLLQPKMAWGVMGVPPRIKPEPALFVVAVYGVRDTGMASRFNDLPTEQQSKFETTHQTVTSLHAEAKERFKKKRYAKAIKDYQQSITVLNLSKPESEEEEKRLKTLKINAFLNLAVCYYKIDKPKYVLRMLESLDFVTDVEKHCKALFYYGRAYEMMGKMEEAVKYYQKALKLEPLNKDIGKALDKVDAYLNKSAKKEKEMWQSVFKTETKDVFDVDEEFQNGVRDMFKELTATNEYAKFDLPNGLSKDEVDFVKSLAKDFEGLVVQEDGEGRKKKVTIVKKLL